MAIAYSSEMISLKTLLDSWMCISWLVQAGSCRMPCFNNSFTGLRHWMRVPWTPSSWRAGWKKGGKFGCRLALATTAAALIFAPWSHFEVPLGRGSPAASASEGEGGAETCD